MPFFFLGSPFAKANKEVDLQTKADQGHFFLSFTFLLTLQGCKLGAKKLQAKVIQGKTETQFYICKQSCYISKFLQSVTRNVFILDKPATTVLER